MNGKDIIWSLKNVSDSIVEEAEYGAFPVRADNTVKKEQTHRVLRRPFLVAAIIAMMLLLVGCAVVYMLSMKEIKLGEEQSTYDAFSYDPDTGMPIEYLGKETVIEQALSFAGMKDTPTYKAAQEWYDFKQSYDPDYEIRNSVWGNEPAFPAQYNGYGLYTQEMKDHLDDILNKYDLKLRGAYIPFRTTKQLFRAMGINSVLNNDIAEMRIHQASYYENGNLDLVFFMDVPGDSAVEAINNTFGCLYYRRKDCMIADYATIGAESNWQEWNYKTASGNDLLVIRAESSYTWVFCDTGNYTVTLRLEADLTDEQVKLIANTINFSLEPSLIKGYESIDDGAVGSGEAVNGYTVSLKSAKTDGYSVYILMSITAPEGVNLENATAGESHFALDNPSITGYSGGLNRREDGDGLVNTCDLLLQRSYMTDNGGPAITKDSVLNMYFEDIYHKYWDGGEHQELISEGVWSIDISFEESDFKEIELLQEPIVAKASVGWKLDGTDAFENLEITSVKLRSLSIDLVSEKENADFFSFTGSRSYAVMKDGTKIEIMDKEFVEPLDLDNVAYILLADGTELMVPEN